jgi:glucosamine 6-phosphate synthetase-like amidotransferase/phosphosugar isomerase protein
LPLQIQIPKFNTNLIIIGDLIREKIAHEIALKIAETSHLGVRSYAIEEFLHGPIITIDKQTSIVIFATKSEPRYEALIGYAKTIGSEVIIIDQNYFSYIFQKSLRG